MYDAFSSDYDRFVDWENRLSIELPFLYKLLARLEGKLGRKPRVLDAACGTGRHAVSLAKAGYQVVGADISSGMVTQARNHAETVGVKSSFIKAGFTNLADALQGNPLFPFDALLCLGNSLPHVSNQQEFIIALQNFALCLRSGGLLLIQNRNFDEVMSNRLRWMEPQSHREGDREWIFIRFYDFLENGLIQFNVLTLKRIGNSNWEQSIYSTRLYPLLQAQLAAGLIEAGFGSTQDYGSLKGDAFNPQTSSNLIVTAFLQDELGS